MFQPDGDQASNASSDSIHSSPGTGTSVLIDPRRPKSTARPADPPVPPPDDLPPAPAQAGSRRGSSFEVERSRSRSRSSSKSPPPPSSSGSDRHNKPSRTGSTRSTGSGKSTSSSQASSSRPIRGSDSHRERSRSRSSSNSSRQSGGSSRRHRRRGNSSGRASAPPAVHPYFAWRREAKTSRQFRRGLGLFLTGLVLVTLGGVTDIQGRAFRHAKIREAVVVDAPSHPEFKAWATGSQQKTPMFYTYHLYNITNPAQFLAGSPPVVDEVGPFSFEQRSRKVNVTFSDQGRLVSYITLTQHDYVGDPAVLEQQYVYSFNLPYSVAVYTAGSESSLLKIGSQQGLAEIQSQMQKFFLPTLKENAVVMAIQLAAAAMKQALNALQWPDDAVQIRWGGGCTSNIFGKVCGFDAIAKFLSAVDKKNKMDLNLLQLCINPKIPEAQQIPLATVRRLWNPKDKYAIFNIDRESASVRYGISYWLWGDADVKDALMTHFGLSNNQFTMLRIYLLEIYRSPMVEAATVKMFLETLPEEDAGTAEVSKWSDFMWRQWAVGDVITRLKNETMTAPESMQPELPPEFAWYAESVGVKTFQYGGKRWNRTQARCMFDLAKRPMVYFQTQVLGLQGPRIDRPAFVDYGLEDPSETLADPRDCFQSKNDWTLMQGYLAHLASAFVAPLLQQDVLSKNGGLVTRRSLAESLYGYAAPILQLSLAKDDPRALKFSLLANDPSLDGPARCLSSNDVENPYTACRFSSLTTQTNEDGSVHAARVFSKVANTYHTGKDDDARAGAYFAYHGDRNIANIWPGGTIPFAGALKHKPGSVQYGYSDGMQFPPFNAIDKPDTVLSVFVSGFVLPLQFVFDQDVVVEGIRLKRFRLSPQTFSSSRPDAKTFGMDQEVQEGLFNLTDSMTGVTYFSKPHFRPTAPYDMEDVQGLDAYDPVRDDSYIDVEPVTGKTMNANIQLQLNAGTTQGAFDRFHKTVYPVKALPVLHVAQHASVVTADANFFKSMVYGTEKLIFLVTVVSSVLGTVCLLVGLGFLLFHALRHVPAVEAEYVGKDGDEEAPSAVGGEGDVEMPPVRSKSSSVSGSSRSVVPPPKPPSKRGPF